MADEYWIDIIHQRPKKRGDVLGADDYVIIPQHVGDRSFQAVGDREFAAVGKKYRLAAEVETVGGPHHHHRSHSRRYWQQPLFYTVDYGEVPVNVSYEDNDIPDDVSGPMKKKYPKSLLPGQHLTVGNCLESPNGRAMLKMQKDGNLVLYAVTTNAGLYPLWYTGVNPGIVKAGMQTDGNLVLSGKDNHPYWNTGTAGHPGARLELQDDGNLVIYQGGTALWSSQTNGFRKAHGLADLVGDITHGINEGIASIPIAGPLIHGAIQLNPVTALGGMTARVLSGERIDHAFLDTAKEQVRAVKEIAPYVKTVMSFVPGVGTGLAAAIAAGTALAEGRSITDAVLEGLAGAVPGGQLGKSVFTGVVALTHGNSLSSVVLDKVKEQLPANVRQAVDTAVNVAQGKNVREAVLQAIRANIPGDVKKALDIGAAVGVARNAQSAVINAVTKPEVINKLASLPVPKELAAFVPHGAEQKAFKVAAQLLSHKGVTPHAVAAARAKFQVHERAGFDHAIKAVKSVRNPQHTSLVRGGLVTRGNWKAVKAGTKGAIPGRLVVGKQITHGHFVRV